MASKEIFCPMCKKGHAPSLEFEHDSKLNLLCPSCGKIMFATGEEEDKNIKSWLVSSLTKKESLPIRKFSTTVKEIEAEKEAEKEAEMSTVAVAEEADDNMPMFF
jgi:hypothetical protein